MSRCISELKQALKQGDVKNIYLSLFFGHRPRADILADVFFGALAPTVTLLQ